VAGEDGDRDLAAGLVRDYLDRYANGALSPDEVISIMVGDLQRIGCIQPGDFRSNRKSTGGLERVRRTGPGGYINT